MALKKVKKVVERGINQHYHSMNMNRLSKDGSAPKAGMRSRATIRRLQMYRKSGPKRNAEGKIVREAAFQTRLPSGTVARVVPDRRWFGNTRMIAQETLQEFREKMKKVEDDPCEIVLKRAKLPLSLLEQPCKAKRMCLLDVESYTDVFGEKSLRKRPKLKYNDLQDLAKSVRPTGIEAADEDETSSEVEEVGVEPSEPIFRAGTSRRVWGELYKVIDSSDVLIEVLDCRDPIGTRCTQVERFLKKEKKHKHILLVLNKCDLVPVWVSKAWKEKLSSEHPTVLFKASVKNPYGYNSLMDVLRQYASLHREYQQISVGLIGYPNVGKSSIINTLKRKDVCKVAPVAGETKVWQYVTLMKRIYLIDSPGCVIRSSHHTEAELVLCGAVRVENIANPEDYIDDVLRRVKKEHLQNAYRLHDQQWTDANEFLEILARKMGRLLKRGEPDIKSVSRVILNDFQRSKLPHYREPPAQNTEKSQENHE